jgi:MFS family permease
VSFATAQLPGGYLSDRIGERATVVASMVLTVVALGMIVLAPGLVPFVAGVVLLGFTTGLYATPRITVLTDVYPDRSATAISVNSALGNLGNATFPVVATVIAGWFAWRAGIGIGLPGFALVHRRTVGRIVAAVTRRPVVLATGAMVCLGFVWQGYTAFLTTYLVEVEGIAQPTAAVALSAVLPRVE